MHFKNRRFGAVLVSLLVGCGAAEQTLLFDEQGLQITVDSVTPGEVGGELAIYAAVSVRTLEEGSFDLTCLQVEAGGLESNAIYVDSVASVIPRLDTAGGVASAVDVYWTFTEVAERFEGGVLELSDSSNARLRQGTCFTKS